jgi:hypothetical protein
VCCCFLGSWVSDSRSLLLWEQEDDASRIINDSKEEKQQLGVPIDMCTLLSFDGLCVLSRVSHMISLLFYTKQMPSTSSSTDSRKRQLMCGLSI